MVRRSFTVERGSVPMFNKSILSFGFAVALATAALTLPAKAAPVGAVVAAGVVGVVLGAGLASAAHRGDERFVEPYPVWDYGVPAYQRPQPAPAYALMGAPGPGRHRVCAWQDRYDRAERYVGSRRICWVEAR